MTILKYNIFETYEDAAMMAKIYEDAGILLAGPRFDTEDKNWIVLTKF